MIRTFAFLCVLIVSGCATTFRISELDPNVNDTLLVYPLLDARENKDTSLDGIPVVNDDWLSQNCQCYVSRMSGDIEVTAADFRDQTPALETLETNGETYVLAVVAAEVSDTTFNLKATLETYLVEVSTGEVVWSDSEHNSDMGFIKMSYALRSHYLLNVGAMNERMPKLTIAARGTFATLPR